MGPGSPVGQELVTLMGHQCFWLPKSDCVLGWEGRRAVLPLRGSVELDSEEKEEKRFSQATEYKGTCVHSRGGGGWGQESSLGQGGTSELLSVPASGQLFISMGTFLLCGEGLCRLPWPTNLFNLLPNSPGAHSPSFLKGPQGQENPSTIKRHKDLWNFSKVWENIQKGF